jgi:type I restriction enzyme S subunit
MIPGFLEWYLRREAVWHDLHFKSKGIGARRESVSPEMFLSLQVPLPPIIEQRRLVERIDALAIKIEEAKSLRDDAKMETDVFRQSSLNSVYEALHTRFGATPLTECCLRITDGTHLTPAFSDEGVRFIFVGNVSSGKLHFNGCKYVNPSYYATVAASRRPSRGDVLYSAVGATLGIPALVDVDEDFCFQRHVAILKPEQHRLDSRYLWYMLRSGILYEKAWASITGTAQPTVPLNAIRSFVLPIPPIAEQRQVVLHLDQVHTALETAKHHQEDGQRELDALLPSILDQAFRAEL